MLHKNYLIRRLCTNMMCKCIFEFYKFLIWYFSFYNNSYNNSRFFLSNLIILISSLHTLYRTKYHASHAIHNTVYLLNFSIFDKEIEKKKKISFEEKLAIHYPLSFCATINFLTCKFLIKTVYHDIYLSNARVSSLSFSRSAYPCRFCFRSTAQFSNRDRVCRVLFPPLSTRVRSISLSTPSIIRSPRFSLAKHTGFSHPNGRSQWSNIGRLRGRGEGKGRKQEKRTRPDKSKGGKRRKRNFLFCRAREATFPVQATAKKVYLGLFPTACFPAIRIFTLPLPTRRHHVFYWHEFQSYFFIYCFSLFLRVLRFLNKDPSVLLWILCRRWWKLFVYVSKWNILIEEEDCSSKFYQWSNILRYNFLRLIYRRFIIYFWNYKFVKILTIRQTILFYFQVLSL